MSATKEEVAIIKGMLKRGDKQQWITAWFGGWLNMGRMSEINRCTPNTIGERFKDVEPASPDELPPVGPYPSGQEVYRALAYLHKGVDSSDLSIVKDALARGVRALTIVTDWERP